MPQNVAHPMPIDAIRVLKSSGDMHHMKVLTRRGLNATSSQLPGFVVGSKVRFISTPVGRR